MTFLELRAKVGTRINDTPAPGMWASPPGDEIKVSHVKLILEYALDLLGVTIDADDVLILPKPPRKRRKRRGR